MVYNLTQWFSKNKHAEKEVTLEDVIPLHPNDYPARNLRARLASRRNELMDIGDRAYPEEMW